MSLPTILTQAYTSLAPPMKSKGPISLSPPLPAAQTAPFEDDKRWKLVLTTSTKVSVWDSQGCNSVFTSGSGGIVAAKGAKDGSVLAIADSQVIMLHRIEEGQEKSYRLKGAQKRCRHLLYDHDSRNLLFTDSIHNSVQSYSLKENRVVDAAKSHPSPITAFAISPDSNLIVSCSADPPIIQIHNRLMATMVSIVPRNSSAPVVDCSFHPTRRNIFVLAFGDGVLAAYDYSKISGGGKGNKDGKVGSMKEVHAFQHLHDPSIAGSAGITGVQFVPGYRSRAVTVGEDGRLFLVDFEMRDTLGSWHIGAPATSLTIRPVVAKGKGDDDDDDDRNNKDGYVIAVGTIHGKCYVYDGNGNKIGEQSVDADGGKVLDVEWVSGDICSPSVGGDPRGPASSISHAESFLSPGSRQSAADLWKAALAGNLKPGKAGEPSEPKSNVGVDFQWPEAQETASQGYMTLFSPVKKKQKRPEKAVSLAGAKSPDTEKVSEPKPKTLMKGDHRSVISAPLLWSESAKMHTRLEKPGEDHNLRNKSPTKPHSTTASPEVQRKPILDKQSPSLASPVGGSDTGNDNSPALAVHHNSSVASKIIKTSDSSSDGKLLSQIRSVRAKVEGDKAVRGNLAIFAPYMSSKVKTSAVVRSGGPIENRKVSSPLQEKALDGNRVEERVGGGGETDRGPITKPQEEIGLSGKGEELLSEDLPSPGNEEWAESDASFDGDIWLVEKSEKSRKRKNSHADDFQPSSSIISTGGRSSSRAGSSKVRKTVSWDDGLASHDTNHSSFLNRGPEPPSSPQFEENTWPSMNVTGIRTRTAFVSDPGGSSSEQSFYTPNEKVFRDTDGVAELDPVLKRALVEVQLMFKAEMEHMQVEMAKEFQVQRNALEDLKNEMQLVREENGKLRNQLFELSGREKRHQ